MPTCSEHGQLCQDIGEIKGLLRGLDESVGRYLKKTDDHIEEADRPGGVRDRVSNLEKTMKIMPWTAMACGFFGALIGKISPAAFELLVRICVKYFGV